MLDAWTIGAVVMLALATPLDDITITAVNIWVAQDTIWEGDSFFMAGCNSII